MKKSAFPTLETGSAQALPRLFLGQVPNSFDPLHDLPVGPWCFVGAENVYPDWESLTFLDAYDTVAGRVEAADKVCDLSNHFVKELSQRLNADHGVSYGTRFWSILLTPWLLALIQASWLRYVHLVRFVEIHKNRQLVCPVWRENTDWNFADTLAFHYNGITARDFDFWLTSVLIEDIAPPSWTMEHIKPERSVPAPSGDPQGSNMIRSTWRGLAEAVGMHDVQGVGAEKILLGLIANIRRKKRHPAPAQQGRLDCEYFGNNYLHALRRLIDATMPRVFREDFYACDAAARSRRYRPGRLRIGTLSQWNDREKFRAGHAHLAGEFLVGVQHGAFYGYSRRVPLATDFELAQDAFLSWGWRADRIFKGNIVPLPSALLSKMRDTHRETEPTVVVVGSHARLHRFHLQSTPTPHQWLHARKDKVAFFNGVGDAIFGNLIYRPYFGLEDVLEDETYFASRFEGLRILRGDVRTFHRKLVGCRLLVADHLGTTLTTAFATNTPTICFWEPDAWPVTDEAKPVFDTLRKAGILFDDGDSAARQVRAVWDDVGAWWNGASVQKARLGFCCRYGKAERFWWRKWAMALWRL